MDDLTPPHWDKLPHEPETTTMTEVTREAICFEPQDEAEALRWERDWQHCEGASLALKCAFYRHRQAALTTAQAEADALRDALHDAICMIGHAMPMDTTVLAGRRLVAREVWQAGYDLLNPKHNKDAV